MKLPSHTGIPIGCRNFLRLSYDATCPFKVEIWKGNAGLDSNSAKRAEEAGLSQASGSELVDKKTDGGFAHEYAIQVNRPMKD